ncbi:MAG TPA: GGDEF domain-containing protein [Burkholderiaceae bacterium]|jgi:diguanylate cyclase (GGDEF)-like protein|nr:GGDEF domain-containing protein [Burkholderiaceae bacterium]
MPPSVIHRLLVALVALTVVALAWNALGMNAVTTLDVDTPYAVAALDDRMPEGGHSIATVTRDNRRLGLDCDIKSGIDIPFCELLVEFGRSPRGIDLSKYDHVRLWISASGPEPRQQVVLAFRSFDPAYATPGDFSSQKVQMLTFEPAQHPQGFDIPLARFGVSDLWLQRHAPASASVIADWTNVTSLSVGTPADVLPGPHRIRVERVELRGKLVAPAILRLALLAMWIASVLAWLVFERRYARRDMKLSAASQLSLQRLNESLRLEARSLAHVSRTDPLTGLLNRSGLGEELVRLARLGGDAFFPLTLVFIDLDHFKQLNDAWGASVGDQVIRELAVVVRSAVQRDDLFARWGGEEFLLVFRDMRALEVRAIAERLRDRVAAHPWPEGWHVTCSFGISEWHRGEDLSDGVRRADEAMYRAKKGGRNRVELQLETTPGDR